MPCRSASGTGARAVTAPSAGGAWEGHERVREAAVMPCNMAARAMATSCAAAAAVGRRCAPPQLCPSPPWCSVRPRTDNWQPDIVSNGLFEEYYKGQDICPPEVRRGDGRPRRQGTPTSRGSRCSFAAGRVWVSIIRHIANLSARCRRPCAGVGRVHRGAQAPAAYHLPHQWAGQVCRPPGGAPRVQLHAAVHRGAGGGEWSQLPWVAQLSALCAPPVLADQPLERRPSSRSVPIGGGERW